MLIPANRLGERQLIGISHTAEQLKMKHRSQGERKETVKEKEAGGLGRVSNKVLFCTPNFETDQARWFGWSHPGQYLPDGAELSLWPGVLQQSSAQGQGLVLSLGSVAPFLL